MQTYGEKWRTNSAACETTHVPRSAQQLLRLDSTGNVTSLEHTTPASNTPIPTQTTDMNHNPCTMKNWVANRVLGLSSLSGSQRKMGADANSMFEYFTGDIMNGTMSNNNMYPRNQKVMQPLCGFQGLNYNGRHCIQRPGLFPCHQFMNSFTNQTPMNYCNVQRFGGGGCVSGKGIDHRQKCRQNDRTLQGLAPKHQKSNVKHNKQNPKISKQDNLDQGEKSSHQSNFKFDEPSCDKVKLRTRGVDNPTEEMGKSKMTQRIAEDLRNMGFDIAQDQEQLDNSSSTLDENKNHGTCEQSKISEPKYDGKVVAQAEITCDMVRNQAENSAQSGTECRAESDINSQDTNFHVLFIRKNWKKGRPSASKQRRRKLQKSKCAAESLNPKGCETEDGVEGSDEVDKNSSMSFILGFNQIPSPSIKTNAANFTFSFSEDENDDYSDDSWDSDSDSNIGHIEAEFSQCDLFNFLPGCNTPSKPINFKVHISPVDIASNDRNECLDRLNKAWGIQVSVEEESLPCINKTKKSSKKVHFPEDEKLHVTHHMYAWSFAYHSARQCYWENFVRDRDRFKRRVQELEQVLHPVLESSHRELMYCKLHGALQT